MDARCSDSGPEKLLFSQTQRGMINLSCGMGDEAELTYNADVQEALSGIYNTFIV